MNCSQNDCKNEARFHVVLMLRCNNNHAPSVSTPIISVCNDHMDVKWDEICPDENFKKIQDHFTSRGFVAPLKEFSALEIVPIKKN